jgi:hypothetical protein
MRQENVELAAHEEELLEKVHCDYVVSYFSTMLAQHSRHSSPADEDFRNRYFIQSQ